MRHAALALIVLAPAAMAQEEAPAAQPQTDAPVFQAPSGLTLTLQDVIWEPETALVRLRFVAEDLGGAEPLPFSTVADDFPWLCETYGVPAVEKNEIAAAQIVISIADRAVPFGTLDADAVQFFEGYSVGDDGACIWEPY